MDPSNSPAQAPAPPTHPGLPPSLPPTPASRPNPNPGASQYRFIAGSTLQCHPPYQLVVRQQPSSARICSFKDKIDRRPLDPPPIIEIRSPGHEPELHTNSNLCLVAHMVNVDNDEEVLSDSGAPCTAGTIVQSPHRLRDFSGQFAVFFAFPDISIRLEGSYRLEFRLYSISVFPATFRFSSINRAGWTSGPLAKVITTPFRVMSPKFFPGMASSSELTRHLAEQGFKLRVRKKTRTIVNQKKGARQAESDPPNFASGSYDSSESAASLGKRKRIPKKPSPFNDTDAGASKSEIGPSVTQTQVNFARPPTPKVWSAGPRDSGARLPPINPLSTQSALTQDQPKFEICPDDPLRYRHSKLGAVALRRPSTPSPSYNHSSAPASFDTLRHGPPRLHHHPFPAYLEASQDPPRLSKPRLLTSEQHLSKPLPRPASLLASRSSPSPSHTPTLPRTHISSVGTESNSNSTSSSHSLTPLPPADYFDQKSGSHRLPPSSDLLSLAHPTDSGGYPVKSSARESSVRNGSRKDIPDVWDKLAF